MKVRDALPIVQIRRAIAALCPKTTIAELKAWLVESSTGHRVGLPADLQEHSESGALDFLADEHANKTKKKTGLLKEL